MICSSMSDDYEVRLLTATDVAIRLAVTRRYAYHLMETGQIPAVWIGRCIRVLPADLEAYIDSLPRNREKDA